MSILKNRLTKLESALSPDVADIHISRIIVDQGGVEPIGYKCGEVEIMRETDESDQELKSRCHVAVAWPIGTSRHIFDPIYLGWCWFDDVTLKFEGWIIPAFIRTQAKKHINLQKNEYWTDWTGSRMF